MPRPGASFARHLPGLRALVMPAALAVVLASCHLAAGRRRLPDCPPGSQAAAGFRACPASARLRVFCRAQGTPAPQHKLCLKVLHVGVGSGVGCGIDGVASLTSFRRLRVWKAPAVSLASPSVVACVGRARCAGVRSRQRPLHGSGSPVAACAAVRGHVGSQGVKVAARWRALQEDAIPLPAPDNCPPTGRTGRGDSEGLPGSGLEFVGGELR